jgi:hypothetical protein
MIIGHDGGQLKIYNPWGYTVSVSESDFVNNRLSAVTAEGLGDNPTGYKNVESVLLPS